MTQHILAEHTEEDARTMRNLRNFVLCFVGPVVLASVYYGFFASAQVAIPVGV